MTAVRTVLISGASIAGPALAHWLHQYGIQVTVVEKAPAPRMGGHAIDIRGAAIDVAERMGALDAIRATVTETERTTFVNADGRIHADIGTDMDTNQDQSLEIVRGDLTRILHELTTEFTEYLYDDSITGLEETPEGVQVTFQRTEPRVFDLVVGADGLHSNTRSLAFGSEDSYSTYLGAMVSISTIPNHLGLDRESRLYNKPGLVVGMFHYTPRFDGVKAFLVCHEGQTGGIDRAPEEDQKQFLRDRFAGAGWESERILEGVAASSDFYFDSIKQIHIDRWSRGRVALLGDAGYCPSPMSGQGSTLAMVGAYILAQELSRHDEPTAALASYEARMRPYVKTNQDIADTGLGFIAPRTRLRLIGRNALLRFSGILARLSGLDQRIVKAADGIDLDAPSPRHAQANQD